MSRKLSVWALLLALASGCDEDAPPRPAPPPPPEPAALGCDRPRKVNDASNLALLPERAGSFCLDPTGSDRGYGDGAKNPLEGMCELFDGECEIYKRFGVKRVVEAHYVDGGGSGATIDVYLSTYDSSESAYAMFTKRVVGDGDPAHPDTARPIAGGGAAGLGHGNAYLWRGAFLAEITYNDSKASVVQMKERGDALLPPLVKAFGDKLPGEAKLPAAAAALPEEKRVPLGIRYVPKSVLDVEGAGPGAFGYYKDGDKRWRVLALTVADEDQAKDTVKSFGKIAGAAEEEDVDGVRFIHQTAEWILGRKGARLLGVGDESRILRDGMSPEEHRSKTLSQDDKRALLRQLLARP